MGVREEQQREGEKGRSAAAPDILNEKSSSSSSRGAVPDLEELGLWGEERREKGKEGATHTSKRTQNKKNIG